jgi:hypothetical protein
MLVYLRWPNELWLSGQRNVADIGPTFMLQSKHIGPLHTLAVRRFGYRANVTLATLGQWNMGHCFELKRCGESALQSQSSY